MELFENCICAYVQRANPLHDLNATSPAEARALLDVAQRHRAVALARAERERGLQRSGQRAFEGRRSSPAFEFGPARRSLCITDVTAE